MLPRGSRRVTSLSLGGLGLPELATQRLNLVSQLIGALGGCFSLRLC
jgi:hypothetical protein